MKNLNISKDFVVINSEKRAFVEEFRPSLYTDIGQKYSGFSACELIAAYEFSEDWQNWEMHPDGDEIVILMSGEVTFVLCGNGNEQRIVLTQPGDYAIVPRGMWHTAKTSTKAKMLFITPGQGSQHKKM